MPRAGRPERPLVTSGPVSQLAGELRLMRHRAKLTYGQLAEKTGLSAATLRTAAAGTRRPTWKVTRAFVRACGGDEAAALALWNAACRAAGREPPGQPPADPPDPSAVVSTADLIGLLNLLRQWADSPSLAELSRRAGEYGVLPPSTVSDMLRKQRLPRLELMLTFVRACGLEEDQTAAWQAAWDRVKARESEPPAASGAPAPGPQEHWQPALSPNEAARIGIPRKEYEQAFLFARRAVEEHQRLGSRRDQWEPTPILNDKLASSFITDGEQELARRLEKEADPAIDESQDLIEDVKGNLDEIAADTMPITGPESGATFSVAEAVKCVSEHNAAIVRDLAAGKHHHFRVSVLLQRLASCAPWLEAVGFLNFVTYYLNVPILEPWRDWLGWSFAVVVVVVIILGQTWLARHAAVSHNHAREARADGNHYKAEQERRNWYVLGTAVTATAITSGMIWRGTGALGNASIATTAIAVFVAIVTGLLLPTLAYLGIALDGSTISRERDSLAADLDDDLDVYLETVSDSRRDLARVNEIGDTLKDKTFPDICHTTQEEADEVYEFYGAVRLLIGSLAADPPSRTTKTISTDLAGSISGYIGTSIPGGGTVNLDPLFDRQRRLGEIEAQRASLLNRIDALPPHPWGQSPRVWPHHEAIIPGTQTDVN